MSADKNHTDLIKYLRGEMTHEEAHAFERKALDDPFLADAIEGAESVGVDEFEKDLKRLDEKIQGREKKPFVFWKIAAVIALLILGGYSVWFITSDLKTDEVVFSEQESEKLDPEKKPDASPEPKEESEAEVFAPEIAAAEKVEKKPITHTEAITSKPLATKDMETEVFEEVEELTEAEDTFDEIVFAEEPVPMEDVEADAFSDAAREEQVETKPSQQKAKKSRLAATGAVARASPPEDIPEERQLIGYVTDDFGDPLPGVHVTIPGDTTQAMTDHAGLFIIEPVNDSTRLNFNSIGMVTQQIVLGHRQYIEVKMDEDTQSLQEVVVTGYGAFDNEPEGYFGTSPVIGYPEFKEYLEEELRYPEEAKNKGIEGRVVLKVTISPTGKISDVEVKRGLGAGCDEEAIRLIKEGPAWTPATHDGINEEATVRIRVKFELE